MRMADDPDYYQDLSARAAAIAPGADGVQFLPYLTGGTNDIESATGCFLNLTLDSDQAVLWRAVLEAIGYDYMEIAALYASAGVDMSRLTITEGGSRDELWNQMKPTCWMPPGITLTIRIAPNHHRLPVRGLCPGTTDDTVAAPKANLISSAAMSPMQRTMPLRAPVRPARPAGQTRYGGRLRH